MPSAADPPRFEFGMPACIEHITLDTGLTWLSPRDEVTDEAVSVCRRLIADMLAGAESAVPEMSATIMGKALGTCLLATVRDGSTRAPLLMIGIAAQDRDAAVLWQVSQIRGGNMLRLATSEQPCPPAPWVAARPESGLARHPEHVHGLADFERRLAWAWLEGQPR